MRLWILAGPLRIVRQRRVSRIPGVAVLHKLSQFLFNGHLPQQSIDAALDPARYKLSIGRPRCGLARGGSGVWQSILRRR